MSETNSGAADMTALGHDPIFVPMGALGSRWDCRRCRRSASQEGTRIWGTAVSEPCEDTESPLAAIKRGAQQVARATGAR
jgi:hypothetical protein